LLSHIPRNFQEDRDGFLEKDLKEIGKSPGKSKKKVRKNPENKAKTWVNISQMSSSLNY